MEYLDLIMEYLEGLQNINEADALFYSCLVRGDPFVYTNIDQGF